METAPIFDFLRQLKENNNREWFAAHKAEYEKAKRCVEAIVNRFIFRIAEFDTQVKGLEAKDCMFRIYRDTRFAHNKTPYKTYFGCYMAGNGGRKSLRAGYYLHLEAGESGLSGGVWCPEPKMLKALRTAVHENVDEFTEILEKPSFKLYYKELWGEKLKNIPATFPKDIAHGELLKPKNYVVNCSVDDNFFLAPDWEERALAIFRELKPFNDFLNYTIDGGE